MYIYLQYAHTQLWHIQVKFSSLCTYRFFRKYHCTTTSECLYLSTTSYTHMYMENCDCFNVSIRYNSYSHLRSSFFLLLACPRAKCFLQQLMCSGFPVPNPVFASSHIQSSVGLAVIHRVLCFWRIINEIDRHFSHNFNFVFNLIIYILYICVYYM